MKEVNAIDDSFSENVYVSGDSMKGVCGGFTLNDGDITNIDGQSVTSFVELA